MVVSWAVTRSVQYRGDTQRALTQHEEPEHEPHWYISSLQSLHVLLSKMGVPLPVLVTWEGCCWDHLRPQCTSPLGQGKVSSMEARQVQFQRRDLGSGKEVGSPR